MAGRNRGVCHTTNHANSCRNAYSAGHLNTIERHDRIVAALVQNPRLLGIEKWKWAATFSVVGVHGAEKNADFVVFTDGFYKRSFHVVEVKLNHENGESYALQQIDATARFLKRQFGENAKCYKYIAWPDGSGYDYEVLEGVDMEAERNHMPRKKKRLQPYRTLEHPDGSFMSYTMSPRDRFTVAI